MKVAHSSALNPSRASKMTDELGERGEATVDPENPVSRRVLEKIGMRYDGRIASSDGELVDYFSIEKGKIAPD